MKKLKFTWLFSLAVVTLVLVVIYLAVHGSMRMGANDPQTELAVDATWAMALDIEADGRYDGKLTERIDIERRLKPFVIIYDKNKKVLDSSAVLEGQTPELPPEVLDHANPYDKHILTWEPKSGVRIAAVIVSAGEHGYVLGGRPLREVEKRFAALNKFMFVAWLGSMLFVTAGFMVMARSKAARA